MATNLSTSKYPDAEVERILLISQLNPSNAQLATGHRHRFIIDTAEMVGKRNPITGRIILLT